MSRNDGQRAPSCDEGNPEDRARGAPGLDKSCGGPHQKPVLLQKGSRGLSGRAASTRTRYGVSASAKGEAKNAAKNASIAEAGRRGRMARISKHPRTASF